jgi:acetylornithine deacetylase
MNYEGRPKTSAVYRLATLIEALHAYEIERNRDPHPPRFYEDAPFLPVVIKQVGGGGDSYGEVTGVPAACYLIAWVEEYPGASQADHTRSLTGFINDYFARQPGFDGLIPEYNLMIHYLPGSSMDPHHPFIDVLQDAFEQTGQPFQVAGAPLACDTYIFNLYSPTPALTLGPRGGNAHASDEFVLVEDVTRLTRIYARAIAEWCK